MEINLENNEFFDLGPESGDEFQNSELHVGSPDTRKEALLKGPATAEAQKEFFNKVVGCSGAWDQYFVSLEDLPNKQIRAEAWKTQLFQDRKKVELAFADLANLDVANKNIMGRIDNALRGSALSVPIDPSRISESLCRTLNICDFSQDMRKPAQREQRKGSMETVIKLKLVLDSSVRLDSGSPRILVIDELPKVLKNIYPQEVGGLDSAQQGKVLVFSEKVGLSKQGRKGSIEALLIPQTISVYDDIHSLQRRQSFIKQQYSQEGREIAEMVATLSKIRNDFGSILRKAPADESPKSKKLREEVQADFRDRAIKAISQHLFVFENAVDQNKRFAHSHLVKAMEFKDSLGRQNDYKSRMLLNHALNSAVKRQGEIAKKDRYVSEDATLVEQKLAELRKVFKNYRQAIEIAAIEKASTPVASATLLFKPEKKVKEAFLQVQIDHFLRRCDIEPPKPEDVKVAPYRQVAEIMHGYYNEFTQAAARRDLRSTQEAMVKLYIVSKFAAANEVVQALNLKLGLAPQEANKEMSIIESNWLMNPNHAERPSFGEVAHSLSQLEKVYKQKRIFSRLRLPEFDQPFRQMSTQIKNLRQQVQAWVKDDVFTEEQDSRYDDLRQTLKSLNVIQELRNLPKPRQN
jgi:hypothetical protein